MARQPKTDALDNASAAIGEAVSAAVLNDDDTVVALAEKFELFQVDEKSGEFLVDEENNVIIDDDQVKNFVEGAVEVVLPFLPNALYSVFEAEGSTYPIDVWLNQDPETPEAGEAGAPAEAAQEDPPEEQPQTAPRRGSGLMNRNRTAAKTAPATTAKTQGGGVGKSGLKRRKLGG